jgi:hypothetical protein
LRDKIEPAHDFTFFCFFFRDAIEDRLDGAGSISVEAMGTSGVCGIGDFGAG